MLADKGGDPLRISAFYPMEKPVGWRFRDNFEKPNWAPDGKNTVNGMFINGKFSK